MGLMMKSLIYAALMLLLSACASTDADSLVAADKPVCARETPTGSNMSVLRCRSPEDTALDKAATDRAKESMRGGPARPIGAPGG
jgi:hypothetical protein